MRWVWKYRLLKYFLCSCFTYFKAYNVWYVCRSTLRHEVGMWCDGSFRKYQTYCDISYIYQN